MITGKLNNEEIIALGLTSNRSPISQNKEILHVNIDPFQLDFSQDWEKTSLTSTSINRKINLEQPIGLSPQHYLNDRNFEKGYYYY